MRRNESIEVCATEYDADKQEIENSVGVLEALSFDPATRVTTATGTDIYMHPNILHATHSGTAHRGSQPMTPNATIVATPAKKRNIYVVAAFSSIGGFLFGADTGKHLELVVDGEKIITGFDRQGVLVP